MSDERPKTPEEVAEYAIGANPCGMTDHASQWTKAAVAAVVRAEREATIEECARAVLDELEELCAAPEPWAAGTALEAAIERIRALKAEKAGG